MGGPQWGLGGAPRGYGVWGGPGGVLGGSGWGVGGGRTLYPSLCSCFSFLGISGYKILGERKNKNGGGAPQNGTQDRPPPPSSCTPPGPPKIPAHLQSSGPVGNTFPDLVVMRVPSKSKPAIWGGPGGLKGGAPKKGGPRRVGNPPPQKKKDPQNGEGTPKMGGTYLSAGEDAGGGKDEEGTVTVPSAVGGGLRFGGAPPERGWGCGGAGGSFGGSGGPLKVKFVGIKPVDQTEGLAGSEGGATPPAQRCPPHRSGVHSSLLGGGGVGQRQGGAPKPPAPPPTSKSTPKYP